MRTFKTLKLVGRYPVGHILNEDECSVDFLLKQGAIELITGSDTVAIGDDTLDADDDDIINGSDTVSIGEKKRGRPKNQL
jgi:hypothetical protein